MINKNDIENINNWLRDDLSKDIFKNRLMFSLTNDYKYIRDTACTLKVVKAFYEKIKSITEPIGIFGAGVIGKSIVLTYDNIDFACFIDNNKAGEKYEGLEVVSLDDFICKYPDGYIVISPKPYWREIYSQLIKAGIHKDKIINMAKDYQEMIHIQYFDLPQLWDNSLQREVFVDCGCFDGNNSIEFKNWCCNNNREGYVYAFEPDPINIMNIENKLNEEDVKHTVIAKGVWNEKDILKFNCGGVGSCIDKDGKIEIEVDSIDNIVKSEVTFIKMDIEGAEYKAIQGARKTIEKYHPKLAVCVYHKPEDIWKLPLLIHEVNPEYKMFLRHYSFAANETVLYAI